MSYHIDRPFSKERTVLPVEARMPAEQVSGLPPLLRQFAVRLVEQRCQPIDQFRHLLRTNLVQRCDGSARLESFGKEELTDEQESPDLIRTRLLEKLLL